MEAHSQHVVTCTLHAAVVVSLTLHPYVHVEVCLTQTDLHNRDKGMSTMSMAVLAVLATPCTLIGFSSAPHTD